MADINQLIYSRLAGFAQLSALVGTRIYPVIAPEKATMPYLVYSREDSQSFHNFGETLDNCFATYSFASSAKEYKQARAVTEAVREALKFWTSTGPPVVDLVQMVNDFDGYQDTTDGVFMAYTSVIDFEVKYRHD